jgi:hypothetical protein
MKCSTKQVWSKMKNGPSPTCRIHGWWWIVTFSRWCIGWVEKFEEEEDGEYRRTFKILAAESKIDTTNPLSIELFKETLPWALMLKLMKLETLLKTINNSYKWVATLDYWFHKVNWAIERNRGNSGKERTRQRKYYFPKRNMIRMRWTLTDWQSKNKTNYWRKESVSDAKKTGHRPNKCPKNNDKKGKEVPKKKMNGRELHTHIQALFKEMTEEDRDEFLKGAKEAGF